MGLAKRFSRLFGGKLQSVGAPAPRWLGRLRQLIAPRPVISWFTQSTEIVTAVVLSAAALLSSWSSYQAALWDGEQAARYSQANATRTLAARHSTFSGQLKSADLLLFSEWLDAYAAHDKPLQAFYRDRFRPEFVTAFGAWLDTKPLHNTQAPPTPFSMPQYRVVEDNEVRRLDERADALFEEGQRANAISDAFVHVTVILASAMFFGGMGQAFRTPKVRVLLIAISAACCVWGLVAVSDLPMDLQSGQAGDITVGSQLMHQTRALVMRLMAAR